MEKKSLITKSNELNEARYKITALEQKLILSVIAEIQPDDYDFKIYKFEVTKLIMMLDLKGKNLYRDLKRITKELNNRELIIIDKDNSTELLTHWFSSVKYFHKEGYIQFRFDPELKPYLLQLKEKFVSYNIKNIVQFKSSYSIRIYELLKQYEKIGNRTFKITELKNILGIENHEYEFYSDFKKRVILSSQKEIPAKTDLDFKFEEIKNGRVVAKIKFIIKQKSKSIIKQKKIKIENDSEEYLKLLNFLPNEQREKKTILNVITKYLGKVDYNYVARNIKYANTECNSNYRVFLCKALSSDWGLELEEEEQAKITKAMDEAEKRKVNAKTEIENKLKQKQINDYIKANEKELKVQAMKILDKEMLKELKEKSPLGRLALIGAMSQIATKKLTAKI